MMRRQKERAAALLRQFKGDSYAFGMGCFGSMGAMAASLGRRAAVVAGGAGKPWGLAVRQVLREALDAAGVEMAGDFIAGAAPNAPREDVFRIADSLAERRAEMILAVGGGSVIDATKAAAALAALGGGRQELDGFFGVGQVAARLAAPGRRLTPIVAVQLASASAAHLTRYANVTDMQSRQKMLIVDDALVPPRAVFDYRWTASMSPEFTMDGAMDGVAHCLEVWMGTAAERLEQARPVCLLGIELIIGNVQAAVEHGEDLTAREALGLGTDLGGLAIMIGGTSGGHLNSFSLVDILPHGRACAVVNPYYVVYFAPVIEDRLREVGEVYRTAGLVQADLGKLRGRALGLAVAEGMINLSRRIGFPTRLADVPGFSQDHLKKCLAAAKDPKLASKLRNMPVPLSGDAVDATMGGILQAAATGDFALVPKLA